MPGILRDLLANALTAEEADANTANVGANASLLSFAIDLLNWSPASPVITPGRSPLADWGDGFYPDPIGTPGGALPVYSWDQAAEALTRYGNSWTFTEGGAVTVTYGFRSSYVGDPPWSGSTGFVRFTEQQIIAAEAALQAWADVANITFVRVGSGTAGEGAYTNNATILFANYASGPDDIAAFAMYPWPTATAAGDVQGDVWVDFSYPDNFLLGTGEYGAHLLVHEIGHAIGLAHPGEYNGGSPTYPGSADYWQDSRFFTVMSYFGSAGVGGSLPAFAVAPQLHDIAAAQLLYGANMTTRTGDTVYGFNSNTGLAYYSLTSNSDRPVFAVWDAGGNDTFDFSGYTTNSHIDLREEAFSGVGGANNPAINNGLAWGNVGIARGAVIENAIGGSGNDVIIGNDVNNVLAGNNGDDLIIGGGGIDIADYVAMASQITWTRNVDGSWTIDGWAGQDTLDEVEFLRTTDRTIFLDRANQNFYDDGTSDILLRRSDGVTAMWDMRGASVFQYGVTNYQAPTDWSIDFTGDFNSDGADDFLLRRDDGVTAIWSMAGENVVFADVTEWQASLDWVIQGVGDFNIDGVDDILWRRASDGVTSIWQMDGTAVIAAGVTLWQAGLDWEIRAIADFNGDGRDDFLWQRTDGTTAIWNMDGANVSNADVTSQQAGAEWTFVGAGDFDGDGRHDLLLQRDDGLTAIWLMNNTNVVEASLTNVQTGGGWSVAAIGDYSGDGQDDILWRRDADGVLAIWTMDGTNATAVDVTSLQVDQSWQVI